MRYLLYYPETGDEDRPFGKTEWWIMKFCGWFGVHPVALTSKYTAEHAAEDEQFFGHSWVWLDPNAEHYLSRTATPRDDVVFVIGHDIEGFYGFEGEGQREWRQCRHD